MILSLKSVRCFDLKNLFPTPNNFFILLLFLLIILSFSGAQQQSSTYDIREYLGSKTPYRPLQNSSTYTSPPEGCELVYSDLLARHGSRYPSKSSIRGTTALVKDLHSRNLPEKYQWIFSREVLWNESDANELLPEGVEEHRLLAERLRDNFFAETVSSKETPQSKDFYKQSQAYIFESTNKSRAVDSAKAFGSGLFSSQNTTFQIFQDHQQDFLLRFFDHCPAYVEQEESLDALMKVDIILQKTHQNIAQRLSVELGFEFKEDQVEHLWALCVFENVMEADKKIPQNESWCMFFTQEEAEALDYAEDLSKYYSTGPGLELSYQISCSLLGDVFSRFEEKIAGTPVEIVTLRFGHAETLLPLLSYLGFGKDDFILSYNTSVNVRKNRVWKTGLLSPFAGNFLALLYRCNKQDEEPTYKVKVLVNEQERILPGCNTLYCPLDRIQLLYPKAFDMKCEFQQLCGQSPDSQDSAIIISITAAICLIIAIFGHWLCWGRSSFAV